VKRSWRDSPDRCARAATSDRRKRLRTVPEGITGTAQAVHIVCNERSDCDFETIAPPTRVGGRE